MNLDPELVETIKGHFTRKSSAQLQAIVQANDLERWSPEAIAAAGEVLREREAGHAKEPLVPETELEPPSHHYDPDTLALGVLSALVTGYGLITFHEMVPVENPDLPLPFGTGMAWLAVETTKTRAVADAVGLKGAREATWEEGIKAAHKSSVFVAPPLGDWTLIASSGLFPNARLDSFVKPLVERLSRQFGDAQYFCTQEQVGLAAWARARKGTLVRGYGWLAQTGTTLWNDGARTREERNLDIQFPHSPSPTSKPTESENPITPNEESVMLLASLWSIDPSKLDELYKEPMPGLLGTAMWA